jgi:hypothetical protein
MDGVTLTPSQLAGTKVVFPKCIAPLRLLRSTVQGGRWPVRWNVMYPDGSVNPIVWTQKRDAIGQASFAVPYHRKGGE